MHDAIDRVAMEERSRAPVPHGDALREHLEDRIELRSSELGIRSRLANEREELIFPDRLSGADRDICCARMFERRVTQRDLVDYAATRSPNDGGALEELIAREREKPPFRRGDQGVAGSTDALHRRRDRARRSDEAREIDGAHVDAELERRCRHDERKVSGF